MHFEISHREPWYARSSNSLLDGELGSWSFGSHSISSKRSEHSTFSANEYCCVDKNTVNIDVASNTKVICPNTRLMEPYT
jgi:hypothetical protein